MSDYKSIKAAIKTKLEAISGIDKVYGWEKGQIEGYPAAVISGFELVDTWIDTRTDEYEITFKMRIYQEMEKEGKGPEVAESILDNLVNSIIDAFRNDRTLGDSVVGCWVSAGSGWTDRELKMRILEINIKVKDVYDLS